MNYKKPPTVTIITACFNCSEYIKETILSVAKIKYKNIEHIIIDDNSTDDSYKILTELKKKYINIKVIRHNKNEGYPSALNTGIINAKSEFVGILDADDLANDNWISLTIPILLNDERIGAVGGGCTIITDKSKDTNFKKYCDYYGFVNQAILNGDYPILHPGTVFRKTALLDIGLYNPLMKSAEDNDLYIGLCSKYLIYSTGTPHIRYRRLPNSESRKSIEYKNAVSIIIKEKAKLIKSGLDVNKANSILENKMKNLSSIPRLSRLEASSYEKEIAYYFEHGGKRLSAAMLYVKISFNSPSLENLIFSFKGIIRSFIKIMPH